MVEHSPVFEAPCGHDQCSSAVWHGICLMEWRERRQEYVAMIRKMMREWYEQHPEGR
jgi:hypothetical protein